MTTRKIPRTIDEPPYVMIWRMDDAFVPLFGLVGGMLLDELPLFLGVGLVASFFYRKYREGRPDLYVVHALYWAGFLPDRGHALINPYVREVRA